MPPLPFLQAPQTRITHGSSNNNPYTGVIPAIGIGSNLCAAAQCYWKNEHQHHKNYASNVTVSSSSTNLLVHHKNSCSSTASNNNTLIAPTTTRSHVPMVDVYTEPDRNCHTAATNRSNSSYAYFFHPVTSQQRCQKHNIHILFLEPLTSNAKEQSCKNQHKEHLLNHLTAMLGRKVHKRGFYHTEIVIPDLECSTLSCPSYLSSSIYNGETVTLTKTKTFANPGYTVLTITVDCIELSKIADYLYECKRMEMGFDAWGMYLAALPFQLNPFAKYSKRTFCSKHVTKALKAAGIEVISSLNENIVTPSKLYRILHDQIPRDRMVIGSVLFKQKALLEQGNINFSIQ